MAVSEVTDITLDKMCCAVLDARQHHGHQWADTFAHPAMQQVDLGAG